MTTKLRKAKIPLFLSDCNKAERWLMKHADSDSFGETKDEILDHVGVVSWDYSSFARRAFEQGEIRVWRAMKLPVLANGDLDLKIDCLGKAWSFKKSGAGVYNQVPHGGRLEYVVVEGIVSPADVDWGYGFISYATYGKAQSEVSMNANAPVLLVAVNDKPLPTPVRGNTGDAREDWGASSCSSSRSGLRELGLARGRAPRRAPPLPPKSACEAGLSLDFAIQKRLGHSPKAAAKLAVQHLKEDGCKLPANAADLLLKGRFKKAVPTSDAHLYVLVGTKPKARRAKR